MTIKGRFTHQNSTIGVITANLFESKKAECFWHPAILKQ